MGTMRRAESGEGPGMAKEKNDAGGRKRGKQMLSTYRHQPLFHSTLEVSLTVRL